MSAHELITRFKKNRLAMLFQLENNQQHKILDSLTAMLVAYPWWRLGKESPKTKVKCFSVSDFLANKESYLDKIEGCE